MRRVDYHKTVDLLCRKDRSCMYQWKQLKNNLMAMSITTGKRGNETADPSHLIIAASHAS